MDSAVRVVIFEAGNRARAVLPRRDTRMCWTRLSLAHHRLEASISCAEEDMVNVGGGVGARSGRVGST